MVDAVFGPLQGCFLLQIGPDTTVAVAGQGDALLETPRSAPLSNFTGSPKTKFVFFQSKGRTLLKTTHYNFFSSKARETRKMKKNVKF